MADVSRTLKIMYATVALCGALTLHLFGQSIPVAAESVESATRWMNARETKEAQIDAHLDATDKDVRDMRSDLSRVIGFGIGISGTLGVLQVLGFIADKKSQNLG
jgi:hypothetical protein